MGNKYLRPIDKVLLSQTVLSSGNGLCIDIEGSKRLKAIVDEMPDKYVVTSVGSRYIFQ